MSRKPARDTTTEAFNVLCDLTLTKLEAILAVHPLVRRANDGTAAFVVFAGLRLREVKAEKRFDTDQLSRWEDDGGAA